MDFANDKGDSLQQKTQANNERNEKKDLQKPSSNSNPLKWIQEEFEDRNLDKVKRTLLVTLDDISKGMSKWFRLKFY